MKDGLIMIAVIAMFGAILYGVSYFPAKWMVKKRILLAKKSLIGQETPQNIELMKSVARAVLAYNTIYLELIENGEYTVTTTVHHGIITGVKVENELVIVSASKDGNEDLYHKALSEKGGTRITAFYLACFLFISLWVCILLVTL